MLRGHRPHVVPGLGEQQVNVARIERDKRADNLGHWNAIANLADRPDLDLGDPDVDARLQDFDLADAVGVGRYLPESLPHPAKPHNQLAPRSSPGAGQKN
jgi:hypothetical protein